MNGTITFDTLAYVKTLQKAGVPDKQAEAMAEAQKNAFEQMVSTRELATKSDLMRLENSLNKQMLDLKADLLKWMFGIAVTQTALLVAIWAILK